MFLVFYESQVEQDVEQAALHSNLLNKMQLQPLFCWTNLIL